jgi:hypothetical protein
MIEERQGVERGSKEARYKVRKTISTASRIREDLLMFFMFILGAIIFWGLGWYYSLIYLAFCGFSLLWFMRFICTHCGNARLGRCPSTVGATSARLFEKRAPQYFRRQFRLNVGILFPCWFAPPLAAIYRLVTGFTYQLLVLLVVFALVAFVILPLASSRRTCEDCVMKLQCAWVKTVKEGL